MKVRQKPFSLIGKNFGASLKISNELWYSRVQTKLPSKEFKKYQIIGCAFSSYQEMYVLSFYLLGLALNICYFRKYNK